MYQLREEDDFALDVDDYVRFIRERGSRVAVVCQPNNPDGGYVYRERIIHMLDELRDLDLIVIDESFIDSVDAEEITSVAAEAAVRHNVSCSIAWARTSACTASASVTWSPTRP